TRVIQLQPWGRIEGTLTSGSKVVPEANVILLRRRAMGAEGMELSSHQAVTGPDGRFRLDTVPPGSLVLGRDWPVGDGREGRTFSPVGEVEVSPGETARVELGCGGRTIVGRVIANPEGRMLAGYSGFHGLYRKMPPPLGPMATRADYEARARTVRALADTGFPTVFSAVWEGNQGRFVVEDVPPGTYDLRFGFTTDWLSSYPRRLPRILGTLSREVVVPAASEEHGDGPLDVGLLQVSFDTAEDDEW
ncbi:MAG: carboxypeptidase-like regulatory domain-containing protein, partial [Nitrospira sp.]|nr:carboxypeptidase-like regulatory domain-containing protein [Nitrospira sp.]